MIHFYEKSDQAYGEFNNGDIIENKPLGFPQDGGKLKPYSNLFYWAHAQSLKDSTIGLHPHRGFEIMTIVLKGNINHYDTLLSKWIALEQGDVQLIQSGAGISHAEAMHAGSSIFQIWFQPDLKKALQQPANYTDIKHNQLVKNKNVTTIVGAESPLKLASEKIEITLHDVETGGLNFEMDKQYFYSFYLIEGELKVNQVHVCKDDFFVISEESSITYDVIEKGQFLCIKSPTITSYPIY